MRERKWQLVRTYETREVAMRVAKALRAEGWTAKVVAGTRNWTDPEEFGVYVNGEIRRWTYAEAYNSDAWKAAKA